MLFLAYLCSSIVLAGCSPGEAAVSTPNIQQTSQFQLEGEKGLSQEAQDRIREKKDHLQQYADDLHQKDMLRRAELNDGTHKNRKRRNDSPTQDVPPMPKPRELSIFTSYLQVNYQARDRREGWEVCPDNNLVSDHDDNRLDVQGCVGSTNPEWQDYRMYRGGIWSTINGLQMALKNSVSDWVVKNQKVWDQTIESFDGVPIFYEFRTDDGRYRFRYYPGGEFRNSAPKQSLGIRMTWDSNEDSKTYEIFLVQRTNGKDVYLETMSIDANMKPANVVRAGAGKLQKIFSSTKILRALLGVMDKSDMPILAQNMLSVMRDTKPPMIPLQIVWIRHGWSCANYIQFAAKKLTGKDEMLAVWWNILTQFRSLLFFSGEQIFGARDPYLTDVGSRCSQDQGKALFNILQSQNRIPDLYMSSTLLRATATALDMFKDHISVDSPLYVVPHIKEHLGLHGMVKKSAEIMSMLPGVTHESVTSMLRSVMEFLQVDGGNYPAQSVEAQRRLIQESGQNSHLVNYDFVEHDWDKHSHSVDIDHFADYLAQVVPSLLKEHKILDRKQPGQPVVLAIVSHSNILKSHLKKWCGSEKLHNNEAYVLPYQLWYNRDNGGPRVIPTEMYPHEPGKSHCKPGGLSAFHGCQPMIDGLISLEMSHTKQCSYNKKSGFVQFLEQANKNWKSQKFAVSKPNT